MLPNDLKLLWFSTVVEYKNGHNINATGKTLIFLLYKFIPIGDSNTFLKNDKKK